MFAPQVSNIGGSGRHLAIDYINPSSSVTIAAGSVTIINNVAYFNTADIPPLSLGSLVEAGGVWRGCKASGGWTNGNKVYWAITGTPNVGTASSGAFNQGASGTLVGIAVMSPDTQAPAATGDQWGYFLKLNDVPTS
jgi:hypothetical protein